MEVIGEFIDRLITVEMRKGNSSARGTTHLLYEAARRKLGVKSLTLVAAQKIIEQVKEGDNVFIVTGWATVPFLTGGETDGPLGAASFARAISLGLGAKPLFVLAERDVDSVRYSTKAAGLRVEDYEIATQLKHAASVLPYPHGDEEAKRTSRELFDEYKPKAIASFETPGPNSKGVIHNLAGLDRTEKLPKLYHLFNEAIDRGILTVAGLDGGNEVGSGLIEEEVREIMPFGNVCRCPCQSGNACYVGADVAIPATTSNWVAYGISAMLAFLLKQPDILQDADTERRMLEACVEAGAADGGTYRPTLTVDGTWVETNQGLVTMMRNLIENGLTHEESKKR